MWCVSSRLSTPCLSLDHNMYVTDLQLPTSVSHLDIALKQGIYSHVSRCYCIVSIHEKWKIISNSQLLLYKVVKQSCGDYIISLLICCGVCMSSQTMIAELSLGDCVSWEGSTDSLQRNCLWIKDYASHWIFNFNLFYLKFWTDVSTHTFLWYTVQYFSTYTEHKAIRPGN